MFHFQFFELHRNSIGVCSPRRERERSSSPSSIKMIRFCPNDGTLLMSKEREGNGRRVKFTSHPARRLVSLFLDLNLKTFFLKKKTPSPAVAPDHRPEAPFPGRLAFVCEACPYAAPVVGAKEREETEGAQQRQQNRNSVGFSGAATVVARAPVRPRPRSQVLGADGADAWAAAGLQKTEHARCPRCGGNEAFFHEVQTRSADEPATLFLRCVACAHQWREAP